MGRRRDDDPEKDKKTAPPVRDVGAATVASGSPTWVRCKRCDTPFPVRPNGAGRQARYCSPACRQASYKAARTPGPGEQRRALVQDLTRTLDLSTLRPLADQLGVEELAAARRHLDGLVRHWDALTALIAGDLPEGNVLTGDTVTAPLVTKSPDPLPAPESAPAVPAVVTTGGLRPTPEQDLIISACAQGMHLVVEAGAGTGKTSTLRMAAAAMRGRGVYLAFNKSIATEAARTFPKSVSCSTAHALAYRAVGVAFRHRLDGPRLPVRETARLLGISGPLVLGEGEERRKLAPEQVARLVMETVTGFCRTAAREVARRHVPRVNGVDGAAAQQLADVVHPMAVKAWEDLTSVSGKLRFAHDVYLKMWQLSGPTIPADFILFDEAQDADPVISAVVQAQQAQLIAVGDSQQQIYDWRGAINALQNWPAEKRLFLTQSWRFGPAIADEANRWLDLLGARLRLTGTAAIRSRVAPCDQPRAVLCRTNGEAMVQAMQGLDDKRRVALVGGGNSVRRLAEAAQALKEGKGTAHPDLCAFSTWAEVQDYVENDEAGADLSALVKLVDDHGTATLINAARRLVEEDQADLTISTAHKGKGREWASVRIAPDFREPKVDEDGRPGRVPAGEARLAYVAVTRAQKHLDRGGLAWIDQHMARIDR
ncbi:UvrD-helicase domain-containing protein [Streptosporangium saharense]|uniref:UvrD-like helicase C-terminal domain-containing protein n=1 Tax=Streptosporangium saharense TaxID=1706840 RepID=A0A7W7QWF9_9ACTN|nr:UvrD-helicase domain-containing protein [Streptosporangium saharense]MBB4920990.1 hypothetical protein [Streptosporangium saharense]